MKFYVSSLVWKLTRPLKKTRYVLGRKKVAHDIGADLIREQMKKLPYSKEDDNEYLLKIMDEQERRIAEEM